jgi:hypothetical protein
MDEQPVTDAAWALCDAAASGKLQDYLKVLERKPRQEAIDNFLDIIHTKDSFLPILSGEETPPEVVDGIKVDSLHNRMGRIDTLVQLLIFVQEESKKLGIWSEVEQQWKKKFTKETDGFIQIVEMMLKNSKNKERLLPYLEDYKLMVKKHME